MTSKDGDYHVQMDSKGDPAQHGARGNAHGCSLGSSAGGADVMLGHPRCGAYVPPVGGVPITGGRQMFGDQRSGLLGHGIPQPQVGRFCSLHGLGSFLKSFGPRSAQRTTALTKQHRRCVNGAVTPHIIQVDRKSNMTAPTRVALNADGRLERFVGDVSAAGIRSDIEAPRLEKVTMSSTIFRR
jgi:hypothetical protein